MTDKKYLILVISIVVIFLMLFYTVRLSEREKSGKPSGAELKEAAFGKLETQMQQLKEMVSSFGQYNVTLHKSVNEEKEKALDVREKAIELQEKFKEAIAQKESLAKELAKAKSRLDLTQPVRKKLGEIEAALSGLDLTPEKQAQLASQLEFLGKELDSINQQIPSLLNENKAYKTQAATLSELLNKKEEELASLKQQMIEERTRNQALLNNMGVVSEQLTKLSGEKAQIEEKTKELENTVGELKKAGPVSLEEARKLEKTLKETQEKEATLLQEKAEAFKAAEAQKESLALLNQKNQELEKEMNSLKTKFEKLNKDYSSLKEQHEITQLAIKQSEAELTKRKEEISYFKGRLDEAEAKAFEIYSKYKDLKKESAALREQNVNVQLEREGLREELGQAKARLAELQNKFRQIGSMVGTGDHAAEGQNDDESEKKIDVELIYPPQLNTKDEK